MAGGGGLPPPAGAMLRLVGDPLDRAFISHRLVAAAAPRSQAAALTKNTLDLAPAVAHNTASRCPSFFGASNGDMVAQVLSTCVTDERPCYPAAWR